MAIRIDDDGTISIYQGDSGEITINGLFEPIYATKQVIVGYKETGELDDDGNPITIPIYETVTTDEITNPKNFKVYLSVYDKKRNYVMQKAPVVNNGKPSVKIPILATETDLWEVPTNKASETYYYGIKACEQGTQNEDTLFIGGKDYGELNVIIVYPKQVEGE